MASSGPRPLAQWHCNVPQLYAALTESASHDAAENNSIAVQFELSWLHAFDLRQLAAERARADGEATRADTEAAARAAETAAHAEARKRAEAAEFALAEAQERAEADDDARPQPTPRAPAVPRTPIPLRSTLPLKRRSKQVSLLSARSPELRRELRARGKDASGSLDAIRRLARAAGITLWA